MKKGVTAEQPMKKELEPVQAAKKARADFQRQSENTFLPWYQHMLDNAATLRALYALYDDPEAHPTAPLSSCTLN